MTRYKTITLGLLQEDLDFYERLRSTKRLLPSMDTYAIELRDSHEAWKQSLSRARPGSDPTQISAEALELAIEELRASLHSASTPTEAGPLSVDAAMTFLRSHSQPV